MFRYFKREKRNVKQCKRSQTLEVIFEQVNIRLTLTMPQLLQLTKVTIECDTLESWDTAMTNEASKHSEPLPWQSTNLVKQ